MKTGKFKFGPWLPDLAELDNDGVVEALNVLFENGQYRQYLPLDPTGAVLAHMPVAAFRATGQAGTEVHVATNDFGTASALYVGTGAGASSWTDVTGPVASSSALAWMFAQYKEQIFATSTLENPRFRTLQSGSAFAKLTGVDGDAPKAAVCGIVGQFLVLGDQRNASGGAPYSIQWSVIDAPTRWPTPNSATAIAGQSGQQFFKAKYGAVLGISEGDQWSVVLMSGSLQRMTYQGGGTVFAFDTIYDGPGPVSQDAWIKVGPYIYFASLTGLYACDGTSIIPIGRGMVDQYFASNANFNQPKLIKAGVHWTKRLIYWTYATHSTPNSPAEMLVYNIDEKKWTHVQDTVQCFVNGEEGNYLVSGIEAFSTTKQCGLFLGSPAQAILTTGEAELSPGGKALVQGVRPQISGPFAPQIDVGWRNNETDSVTYVTGSAVDSFTGSSNVIVDARYHRARFTIAGGFDAAVGGEFDAQASSQY